MVFMESRFDCAESMTPEVAVRLMRLAEKHQARLQMEYDVKRVRLDSLLGILSMPCVRGATLTIIAEGPDEQAAAEAVKALLEGD